MMVLDFYKLQEQPFGVTPDSRYLFLSPTHKEALTSLVYGIEAGCGFVALIATPGLGKTTLLFQTLGVLRDRARIVFLFQTISTPLDLLRSLLSGLGVRDIQGSMVELQLKLKDVLAEQYRLEKRVVLVIDEAQNLDDSVLELVRILSNFETAQEKLIQIILSGQTQLADNMSSPELVQLRQRISIFARLTPFTPEETAQYIGHRVRVAGYGSDMPLFTRDALAMIAQASEGIPRNINNLCFNALSLGCALKQKPIDREVIRQVVADLDLEPLRKRSLPAPKAEEKSITRVPAFLSTENFPSAFAGWMAKAAKGWMPKAAIAILVLAVSLALIARARRSSPEPDPVVAAQPAPVASTQPTHTASVEPAQTAPDEAASVQPDPPELSDPAPTPEANSPSTTPALTEAKPPSSGNRPTLAADSVGTVMVAPGQTLLRICIEKFGNCTRELLQQIHELNPSLSDPDHIESGQKIRVPVLGSHSSVTEEAAPAAENGARP
jgi:general secretion pathway protein A